MNRKLYQLCIDYVRCYDVLQCLISLDEIESERLTLFRLTNNRLKRLEEDFEREIIENNMVEK